MADRKSAQIVTTAFSRGGKHDFQLFKDDACKFSEHLRILADAGYQGLSEFGTKTDCDRTHIPQVESVSYLERAISQS